MPGTRMISTESGCAQPVVPVEHVPVPPVAAVTALSASAGAVGLGAVEAVARARQRPGQIPAFHARLATSVALVGWGIDRLGGGALLVGLLAGGLAGLLGIRPRKVVLGPLVGLGVSALGAAAGGGRGWCVPADRGAGVPAAAGEPAGRAGPGRRPAVGGRDSRRLPTRERPAYGSYSGSSAHELTWSALDSPLQPNPITLTAARVTPAVG